MGALRGWGKRVSHAAVRKGRRDRCLRCSGRAQGQLPQMFRRSERRGRVDGGHSVAAWDGGLLNPPHTHTDAYSGTLALLPLLGCELSGHTRSFTFKVEEEDDAEHVLALTMVRDGCGGWW